MHYLSMMRYHSLCHLDTLSGAVDSEQQFTPLGYTLIRYLELLLLQHSAHSSKMILHTTVNPRFYQGILWSRKK